jgi:hypothetical protein
MQRKFYEKVQIIQKKMDTMLDLQKHLLTWKITREEVKLQFDSIKRWKDYMKMFDPKVSYLT